MSNPLRIERLETAFEFLRDTTYVGTVALCEGARQGAACAFFAFRDKDLRGLLQFDVQGARRH